MTIGIAAYGQNAGRAVLDGLRATEVLGRGAIGGFAVFSILDRQGVHRQIACQRGGASQLQAADAFGDARCAAVISSGPDRPEPLSQFLVAGAGLGLVTGHRLPNRIDAAGVPSNASVLRRMARGETPSEAVQAAVGGDPEMDAGLIAVTLDGRIGFANTARVARRCDLIQASRADERRGYALLGNSIHFAVGCGGGTAIGDVVWSRLSGGPARTFLAELAHPVPVCRARTDRVEIDAAGRVTLIRRADPWWPEPAGLTTVIYSRAPVWQDGRPVGVCASEVFARLAGDLATPSPEIQSRFAVERDPHVTP
ncbi:DUF6963 family protein [Stappia stellulata]|uniref:DUF6963 family protein n=1 Tax=Stappia stellulata TaxID=71235 RepID=UPI0004173BD9|nr:hypothetical protein [Stappia stellulata]